MQQLLGDKATNTDVALMRKLFLLHLPSDVYIVLASTLDNESIEDFAQLADKIMEVALPSVSNVTISMELQPLRQGVTDLKCMVVTIS